MVYIFQTMISYLMKNKSYFCLTAAYFLFTSSIRTPEASACRSSDVYSPDSLKVSAHRGNSRLAPENTLATFREVLKMKIDYIEIDVRTSKDGRLLILHDGTLNRTTNGEGPMKDFDEETLRKLSAGKGFDNAFASEKIPTLEETCSLVSKWNAEHHQDTQLYVDCKDVQPEPLVKELARYKLLKDAVFYGSDDFLLRLKTVYPEAKLMPALNKPEDITTKIEKLKPYAFDVKWQIMDENLVKTIHSHKIKAFTDLLGFTDLPANYKKASDLGVDVIQTDFVQKVYGVLGR